MTTKDLVVQIAGLIALGIAAQWTAWRFRLPSIFVLLLTGLLLGPGTGLLDPDALLGHLLLPMVSLSVAVVLFEGGLNLRWRDLHEVGNVVRNLVTVGCVITWIIATVSAMFIFGLSAGVAALLGAVLVVTGPTVTIPLIRHIRPIGRIGHVVKWEGIVIDPIGAVMAVMVYEIIVSGGRNAAASGMALGLFETVLYGTVLGLAGAVVVVVAYRPGWVPDYLHNHVALAAVLGAYATSNFLQKESGLLAVTVMGIALANQHQVSIRRLIEFKEDLRALLLSILFLVLGARLHREDIAQLQLLPSLLFLAVLVFIGRPLAVAVSTWRTKLTRNEKLFLAGLAPRGVVAAAVASVFALELRDVGHPQADMLIPLTFLVVIGTVALYGLTASPLARRLSLGQPDPQGVLIAGAHSWARAIAGALRSEGFSVRLVDTNWANVSSARMEGLSAYHGSILSEETVERVDLGGIGRLLAVTSNDEANALAALHFSEIFGRSEVYQLPTSAPRPHPEREFSPKHLRGRTLFSDQLTYAQLTDRFREGAVIKRTTLTREFDYEAFRKHYGDRAVPLFVVGDNRLQIFNADRPPTPRPGQKLISLVDADIRGPGEVVTPQAACALEEEAAPDPAEGPSDPPPASSPEEIHT